MNTYPFKNGVFVSFLCLLAGTAAFATAAAAHPFTVTLLVQNSTQIGLYPQKFETNGTLTPDPQPMSSQSTIQYNSTQTGEGTLTGTIVYGPCHFHWRAAQTDSKTFDLAATTDEPLFCSTETKLPTDNSAPIMTFTIKP